MQRKFEYQLKLDGKTLEEVSPKELRAEWDRFKALVRASGIAMNGADTRFEQAFQIVIQGKVGNSLYEPDAEGEAYLALGKGFSYTQSKPQRFKRGDGNSPFV